MNYISQISKWEFDEKRWVVSLLNAGSKYTGHAVIVVEGVQNNNLFVGQYEVVGKIIVNETVSDKIQHTTGNSQGYITQIRVIESVGKYGKNYTEYSHTSWYAQPENVNRMIKSIKNAQLLIQQAIEKGQELPFTYQSAGSRRWWVFGGNGGDNCLTWAEKQLELAEVGNGVLLADWVKALPQIHTDDCVIS